MTKRYDWIKSDLPLSFRVTSFRARRSNFPIIRSCRITSYFAGIRHLSTSFIHDLTRDDWPGNGREPSTSEITCKHLGRVIRNLELVTILRNTRMGEWTTYRRGANRSGLIKAQRRDPRRPPRPATPKQRHAIKDNWFFQRKRPSVSLNFTPKTIVVHPLVIHAWNGRAVFAEPELSQFIV